MRLQGLSRYSRFGKHFRHDCISRCGDRHILWLRRHFLLREIYILATLKVSLLINVFCNTQQLSTIGLGNSSFFECGMTKMFR
jgi:hypothetical protein